MSRNERKGSTREYSNSKTDNNVQRGTQSKGPKSSDPQRVKIENIKTVTGWPEEDINRVLEKYSGDEQLATSSILDGLEGEPTTWNKVVSKRTKTEQNKAKQKDNSSPSYGGRRGSRRNTEDDEKRKEGKRNSGPRKGGQGAPKDQTPKENGNVSENAHDKQTQPTNGTTANESSPAVSENVAKETQKTSPPQHKPETTVPAKRETMSWASHVKASEAAHNQQAAKQEEVHVKREESKPAQPTQHTQPTQHQQATTEHASVSQQQSGQSLLPAHQQLQDPRTTNTARHYNPPGMKSTWKPKENQQPQTKPDTEQAHQPIQHAAPQPTPQQQQQQTHQPATHQPVSTSHQTTTQITSNQRITQSNKAVGPVILPSSLANFDARDLQFGNFGASFEEESTTAQITSSVTQTTNNVPVAVENNSPLEQLSNQTREQQQTQEVVPPQMQPMTQQPPYYALPMARAPNFAYPNYGGYEGGEMTHFPYEGDGRPMMSYDPQQQMIPNTYHAREPSPSDSTKYMPRTDSNQGTGNFRDTSKYNPQDNPTQQNTNASTTTTGQNVTPGQQQAYGYGSPFYGYPYINQYSYQNPYPPRYYARSYPNFPNTPQYPAPQTSSNLYGEEMVAAAEYGKNIFSAIPSPFFHSTNDQNVNNMLAKNPQQNVSTGGKSQSLTQTNQTASPEITSSGYKGQQVTGYGARDTNSAPNTYYTMAQQQYAQQATTPSFPYMHIQGQQYPARQQYMPN